MRLQIDTENFTVGITEEVNIGELLLWLEKLLPKGEWKKYKIHAFNSILWNNPIIIESAQPLYPYPFWEYPMIAYNNIITHDDLAHASSTVPPIINSGFFNIKIK